MKYKVGDKVRIRKDLKIGVYYDGCLFAPKMQSLCGETAYITEVVKHCGVYHIDSSTDYWTDEMFEDVEVQGMNKRVVIYDDENEVIAYCGDKVGVARCHPYDKFDFYTGAKLALERLEEAENPYAWLKEGTKYYIPSVYFDKLYDNYVYGADDWDKRGVERGIVFKTKEEAIECAKKMLKAVKQED